MNKKSYFLVMLALSLCACGKSSAEPQTATTDTQIVFDWSQKSEEDAASTSMWLLLYPSDGGSMIQQEVSADQVQISLPVGDYRVIAVSNDCETAKLRGESTYETAEAYVAVPATRGDEVLPKIEHPQYASVKESTLSVKVGGVDNTYKLLMQSIVKKIKFQIIVELDKPIEACTGMLTGISPAVNLSTLEPLRENPVRVVVNFIVSPKEAQGETVVFGVNPDIEGAEKVPNKLLLSFSFKIGRAHV